MERKLLRKEKIKNKINEIINHFKEIGKQDNHLNLPYNNKWLSQSNSTNSFDIIQNNYNKKHAINNSVNMSLNKEKFNSKFYILDNKEKNELKNSKYCFYTLQKVNKTLRNEMKILETQLEIYNTRMSTISPQTSSYKNNKYRNMKLLEEKLKNTVNNNLRLLDSYNETHLQNESLKSKISNLKRRYMNISSLQKNKQIIFHSNNNCNIYEKIVENHLKFIEALKKKKNEYSNLQIYKKNLNTIQERIILGKEFRKQTDQLLGIIREINNQKNILLFNNSVLKKKITILSESLKLNITKTKRLKYDLEQIKNINIHKHSLLNNDESIIKILNSNLTIINLGLKQSEEKNDIDFKTNKEINNINDKISKAYRANLEKKNEIKEILQIYSGIVEQKNEIINVLTKKLNLREIKSTSRRSSSNFSNKKYSVSSII